MKKACVVLAILIVAVITSSLIYVNHVKKDILSVPVLEDGIYFDMDDKDFFKIHGNYDRMVPAANDSADYNYDEEIAGIKQTTYYNFHLGELSKITYNVPNDEETLEKLKKYFKEQYGNKTNFRDLTDTSDYLIFYKYGNRSWTVVVLGYVLEDHIQIYFEMI